LIGVSAGAAFATSFVIVIGLNYLSENFLGTLLLPLSAIFSALVSRPSFYFLSLRGLAKVE